MQFSLVNSKPVIWHVKEFISGLKEIEPFETMKLMNLIAHLLAENINICLMFGLSSVLQ